MLKPVKINTEKHRQTKKKRSWEYQKVTKNKRYYEIINDIFYSNQSLTKIKIPSKYMSPVYFHGKGLDFIYMNNILSNKEVVSKPPNILQNDEASSLLYNLGSTTLNQLLNYKDINYVDVDDLETLEQC